MLLWCVCVVMRIDRDIYKSKFFFVVSMYQFEILGLFIRVIFFPRMMRRLRPLIYSFLLTHIVHQSHNPTRNGITVRTLKIMHVFFFFDKGLKSCICPRAYCLYRYIYCIWWCIVYRVEIHFQTNKYVY